MKYIYIYIIRIYKIDELVQKLEFRDPNPVYIDITPENAVVTTLQESKIDCLTKDKVIKYSIIIFQFMIFFFT